MGSFELELAASFFKSSSMSTEHESYISYSPLSGHSPILSSALFTPTIDSTAPVLPMLAASLSHEKNDQLPTPDSSFNFSFNSSYNNYYYTKNYTNNYTNYMNNYTNYTNNYSYNSNNNTNSTNTDRSANYKHCICDTKTDASLFLTSSSLRANDISISKK